MKQQVTQLTGHIVKRIGSGAYSKAYRSIDDPTVVFIVSSADDPVKEIISHVNHTNVPKMHKLADFVYQGRDYDIWQTEYSAPVKKSHSVAYNQMMILIDRWNTYFDQFTYPNRKDKDQFYALVYDFIMDLRNDTTIDATITDGMMLIYTWCTSFGPNFLLDLHTGNFGIDNAGNLLLRDIVYFK